MPYPRLLILAAVVVVVAAIYFAQAVLMPVAMAVFLSFVLSPFVTRLERLHLGRVPSVLIVALLAFFAIGAAGWIVGREAMNMVTRLPEYRVNLETRLAVLRERVQGPLQRASDAVEELERGSAPAAASEPAPPSPKLGWATMSLGTFVSMFGTAGVVAMLVFIMLVQRGDLRDRFIALAGGGVVTTTQGLDEAAFRLSRYLLVLTVINACYGTAIGLGLWLIGVPNSLLWGILAAALRFVPYAGPCVSASIPILFSFAISESLTLPLLTCGLFVVCELVTNMVVEPMVLPNHIGVSTTALVVSAVFWTWLWGLPGLVLATPLTVCVVVMGRHIPQMRFLSVLLGDQHVLSPALRIYQRLLVGEAEEAWGLVSAELKGGKSVLEVFDSLLLPALCLAQQDRRDRLIDEPTLVKVAERARELSEDVSDRRDLKTPAIILHDPLRVVCVAAEKESDGAASSILCDLLRHAGVAASEAPHGALVSEALEFIGAANAGAVCVSQIPPLSFTRLRYVCKRIAERFPGMPILVGTWTRNLDPVLVHGRLESDGRLQVAGSLSEMLQQIERLAALARSQPAAVPPVPPLQEVAHAR